MTGLTYPYTKFDRLLGDNLSLDLEMDPAPVPPAGTAGGAGRYRYWADTTNPLGASLRQAVAVRATAGVYVPTEWLTWGTIDIAARKFHFNTDGVDFTEGTGPLIVHDLSVTNGLTVGGTSTLHNTSVIGNLSVSGTSTFGVLNAGATTLASLSVTGASALHGTTITGDLSVSGAATITGAVNSGSVHTGVLNVDTTATIAGNVGIGGGLGVGGTLNVTGASTLTGIQDNGGLTVTGNANIAGILTAGSASITGGLTVGGNFHVVGNSDLDGTLNVDGASTLSSATIGTLHVTGNSDFDGAVNIDGDLTAHHITAETLTLTGVTPDEDIHTRDIFARNITTSGDVVVGHNFQVVGECLPLVVGNTRVGVNGIAYQVFDTRTDPTFGVRLTAFDLAFSIQPTGTGGGYPNLDVWFNNGYVFTINAFYSDPRTKTNIVPSSTDALSLIRQVKTYEFDQYGNHVELGVMGDQLGPLIPNSIMTGPSENSTIPDLMQVNVATMITYMLRSIQQLDESHTGFAPLASPTFTGTVTIPAGASIAGYAPLASPAMTGTPTAPTPARTTANTQLATTAFVRTGTNTNDDAPAGQIGEFQSAQVLSTAPINLVSNVDTSILTLSLTPGDWEVHASVGFNMNNPNNVTLRAWVNPTGALAYPSIDQIGGHIIVSPPNNTPQAILPTTSMRISLAATTAIRLGTTCLIGGGTVAAWGKIMARRVR